MRSLLLVLGILASVLVAAPASAGEAGSFLAKMNAERTGRGLPALRSYGDLADDARAQAARMAEQGAVFHNPSLGSVTSGWERLGENVGSGESVDALHAAFMASSTHRANILGDFNYAGVGVVVDDAGVLWVAVVFMKGPDDLLDPPPTTTTTTTTVPATSTTTTTSTVPATSTTTTTTVPVATAAPRTRAVRVAAPVGNGDLAEPRWPSALGLVLY